MSPAAANSEHEANTEHDGEARKESEQHLKPTLAGSGGSCQRMSIVGTRLRWFHDQGPRESLSN
jgi:hypothetical protein